ncbi:MAG: type II toxin-antitoxin system VapC family toxin [Actinomycetota bacterium]|nr:type II toxin-antitoxin system VapC family toxin [Actinomycetota bacterium]
MNPDRGLLDTSVLIAAEVGRDVRSDRMPKVHAVSVVTAAELQAGVLSARDTDTRARRLATFDRMADMALLPIDETVAAEWARLRVYLAEQGRRVNVNDLWIAATAAAHRIPVVTQDTDFDPLEGASGVVIVRV